MKITNKTRYETADLRRVFAAGLKHIGVDSKPYIISVVYARQKRYITGWGIYNGPRIHIRLPKPVQLDENTQQVGFLFGELANVFEHEVAHNRGIEHKDMDRDCYSCHSADVPVWARGMSVTIKPMKTKPTKGDRAAGREAHAIKMWETWKKRAETAKRRATKWERKVNYYERKKAGTPPPQA